MKKTAILSVCLAWVVSLVTGCGRGDMPELGDVYGKVTLDGKPVSNINILFTPETGRPAGVQLARRLYFDLVFLLF